MPDIREYFYFTSSEADVLSNSKTGLDLAGGPGTWSVWASSSVVTATVSATTRSGVKINGALIPLSPTTGLKVNEVAPYVFQSDPGSALKPVISVGGTTGNVTMLISKTGAPAP